MKHTPFPKKHALLLIMVVLLNACGGNDPAVVDCAASGLALSLESVEEASGCSTADGQLTVVATGGESPYQFSIDETTFQATGDFTEVLAGIYTVSVTDANGCQAVVNNVQVDALGFSVETTLEADSECVGGNGTVTINAVGDNEPFLYKLADGTFTDNNTFTGLDEGNHVIIVKDNSDCSVSLTVTIPRGDTGTSWANDIKPIIESSCALSGCHNGGTQLDLRVYENAKDNADKIREYTQSGYMPFEGSITQEEIDLIACWVDDGAVEN